MRVAKKPRLERAKFSGEKLPRGNSEAIRATRKLQSPARAVRAHQESQRRARDGPERTGRARDDQSAKEKLSRARGELVESWWFGLSVRFAS